VSKEQRQQKAKRGQRMSNEEHQADNQTSRQKRASGTKHQTRQVSKEERQQETN
jgi:hypothetical protein